MGKVFYERAGEGEPLVLIHGVGRRRQAWEPVVPLLTPYRDVITIDLPGFGQSPPSTATSTRCARPSPTGRTRTG